MQSLILALAAGMAAVVPAIGADASSASKDKDSSCGECCGQSECAGLVATYEKVSTALAADDLTAAQAAAVNLACCLKCEEQPELAAKVEAFNKASSIADARTAFKAISAAIIPLAEKSGDCYIMTCPMAGADWVQTTPTLANPYYGASMLRCGSIKKTVKAGS